ncbi:MAG TPA: phosphoribosylanthranilate isomerase [Rhodospirillaceae bacterium]|nr:phosphoribosylanthranilate isomerase [Rhodospirillaceae bacterium]
MKISVKICGISDDRGLVAAVEAGASQVGFVFFRQSPRYVVLDTAAELVAALPRTVTSVGLFVDPTDRDLDMVISHVRLGMVQLHGRETPQRVDDVRAAFGLPVIKAIGVSKAQDIHEAEAYEDHADWLMFDAKAPKASARPGGNAVSFDWSLARSYAGATPWMLAGGLTPRNVAKAIKDSGARKVDVSSGVETRPGIKSPAKIRAFLSATQGLASQKKP